MVGLRSAEEGEFGEKLRGADASGRCGGEFVVAAAEFCTNACPAYHPRREQSLEILAMAATGSEPPLISFHWVVCILLGHVAS